jgi:hypothetical protein
VVNDRSWPTVKVFDECGGGIDTEVVVDGCEEIAGGASAFDGIFATFVCSPNDLTGANSTTCPDI